MLKYSQIETSHPLPHLEFQMLVGEEDESLVSSRALQLQAVAWKGAMLPVIPWLLFWGQQGSFLFPFGCG